ncbi:hypothetical protein HGQ17_06665 [Nesterenkonia sp. MY13]|uniref:DUF6318 domain-containing protein n=1 Tax=Nesterenkonia sedimenti TaxID=1463632 RepID=A0A7X8TJF5_9MICC|nr:DUF6318 family protein [Nesterenkonia sedimenti]NLS09691.1 hypothetical protein [Nesterenkonia sedimenti]
MLESLPAAEGTETGKEDPGESAEPDEPSGDSTDDDDAEPVPASSDGPAENWPKPEVPEEIYEPTEEGAEALIQYWFDARHYARITGDLEPLEYVSAEDCDVCDYGIAAIAEVYENNGWYVSEPEIILDSYVQLESETNATGIFGMQEPMFQTYWQEELYDEKTEDNFSGFGYSAVYVDDRWQVFDFSYLGEYDEEADEPIEDSEEL